MQGRRQATPVSFPPSSSQSRDLLPSSSNTDDEAQRLIDVRNSTNYRSVTRNDPSVIQILETSVYSVIYQYDEVAGEWEKQKQEGPLFVVQRDRSPEYAVFMLNRQTVKNVLIPLIPGEMKLNIVDTSTLQVARRGEKQRRGIWFSEGTEAVERFKATIYGICGEPTRKASPSSTPKFNDPSPSVAGPSMTASSSAQSDGFSRLFAGLMVNPTSPNTNGSINTPSPAQAVPTPPVAAPKQFIAPVPNQDSPQATSQPTLPSHNTGETSNNVPGQSADDLLMSILGVAPAPKAQPPSNPVQQAIPPPQLTPTTQPPTSNSQANESRLTPVPLPLPSQISAPTTLPNHGTSSPVYMERDHITSPRLQQSQQPRKSRVGDVTFAQATATPLANLPPQPMPSSASPLPQTMTWNPHLARDATIPLAQHYLPPNLDRNAFVAELTRLLHTNEDFVRDLWAGYAARLQNGRPPD